MQEDSLSRIANAFDLHDARLNLISGGQMSYVYESQDDKRPLILRVVKNGGDRYKLTCAETDFVKYLTDNGINASRPVTSRSGALTELLEVTEGKFIVTAFERAPGKPVSLQEWTPSIWEALGEELGSIHRLAKDYYPATGVRRPHWHEASIMDIDRYIPRNHRVLRDKAHELIASLKKLPMDGECYGLIHSDPNRGNLCALNGRITLFDFEDCEYHWFVNDLAVALYFALEDSFNGQDIISYTGDFMQALLRGYSRQNHLDAYWLEQIVIFHKLRDLLTILYFYADGGNSPGEHEIARAVRSRMNLELDRPYISVDINTISGALSEGGQ
ncbi:MAG: phosphotransferase [Candidatus Zixiibacteriota bacterium]|nr:MAG: phosphotransferase [candidate division Zixibacteria bacterium]